MDRRRLRARRRIPVRRRWFYQIDPHDVHDYDGINEQILLDMRWSTDRRGRCSFGPDRNGYFYVIDRTTGEVLSADPFGP